ncbi:MAG: hypothetical protein ACRD0E_01540, partial [Acidimicrobiales bacterium]
MTSGPGGGDVVEVHLLRLPVSLWARTQEHADGLLREFALIAEAQPAGECPTIPRRLSLLVEELNAQYSSITTEQEAILANALNGGLAEIDDLAFRVPIDTSSASVHLDELLDEADRYCLAGEHLLT